MARARGIKPAVMDNEYLAALPPLTRLLFVYIWMLADREGRLEDRPARIAAQALPYDRDAKVEPMLDALAAAGFILRYQKDGLGVIQVVNFSRHQRPHPNESESELPPFDPNTCNLGVKDLQPRSEALGPSSLIPSSLIPDNRTSRVVPKPEGVPEEVWMDFLQIRKAKRAPMTATALKGFVREAGKAGVSLAEALAYCCVKGWQGFDASWFANNPRPSLHKYAGVMEGLTGRKMAPAREAGTVIDIVARQVG